MVCWQVFNKFIKFTITYTFLVLGLSWTAKLIYERNCTHDILVQYIAANVHQIGDFFWYQPKESTSYCNAQQSKRPMTDRSRPCFSLLLLLFRRKLSGQKRQSLSNLMPHNLSPLAPITLLLCRLDAILKCFKATVLYIIDFWRGSLCVGRARGAVQYEQGTLEEIILGFTFSISSATQQPCYLLTQVGTRSNLLYCQI